MPAPSRGGPDRIDDRGWDAMDDEWLKRYKSQLQHEFLWALALWIGRHAPPDEPKPSTED